jgi:biotin transporter BioY
LGAGDWGLTTLFGATGGYLIGFMLAHLVVGTAARQRSQPRRPLSVHQANKFQNIWNLRPLAGIMDGVDTRWLPWNPE